MTTAIADRKETQVARPLKVLTPLIREDFEAGDDAAEEARKSFDKAAGEKLIEARDGHFYNNTAGFYKWAEKEFGKSQTSIRTCVAYAGVDGAKSFKSKHEAKYTDKKEGGLGWTRPTSREWTGQVDAVAERARKEAFRIGQEDELTRVQERDAERKLAHRLIDIGYKVLAIELHPDKVGGSKDAMARLNRVRDKLKHSI